MKRNKHKIAITDRYIRDNNPLTVVVQLMKAMARLDSTRMLKDIKDIRIESDSDATYLVWDYD